MGIALPIGEGCQPYRQQTQKGIVMRVVIGCPPHGFLSSVRRTDVSEITAEWVEDPDHAKEFHSIKSLDLALIRLNEAGYSGMMGLQRQ